ncbi:MAG: tRNA (cytidine(34)-2'-O)-methyltransferase [Sphingomonadales bacterium]|nr:tRNA (cytidine(34)-2'-O)-methyltransferase [Sphingomonadales bacterium]
MPLRIALYQPDIAGNVGTILRMAACFGTGCDIIHPCGFAFSRRSLKRAGMDYLEEAEICEHSDWNAFKDNADASGRRIILLSSKASVPLTQFQFERDDIILMGSESAGAPGFVHDRADMRVHIPMQPGFRSLNVAVALASHCPKG